MTSSVNVPYFPDPPEEYSRAYIAEVTRAFSLFAGQVGNPGQGRNTFTVFTNLQQNDYGLEEGTIYRQGNVVYITVKDTSSPAGVTATASTGVVTVVIT
jgi:hypothetical protein|tara:strand:- start:191 stop:487 length:297 start_codon:yes stop_codon:yes gene_type:complete